MGKDWFENKISEFNVAVASFTKYNIKISGYMEDINKVNALMDQIDYVRKKIQIFLCVTE